MFCSNCGAQVNGKFCSNCGAAVGANNTSEFDAPHDWAEEVKYERLVRVPEIRELISKHASMANKSFSGEDFLAFADKVIPSGVSIEKLASALQPIYTQMGIKTGKESNETLAIPIGKVIVTALCSLARHGQVLQQVRQFEDGCLLEATLPSDLWSFAGTLYISVRKAPTGTRVEGATTITGQLFDWGKSKRCLETLFADIKATPA
jgi:hypothetical protein